MSDPRPLLVGQAPSASSDPLRPLLGGRSGERLRLAAGLSVEHYILAFRRTNLLPTFMGKRGPRGDAFDRRNAREAADMIIEASSEWDQIVCVGRAVAQAFGLRRSVPPFLFTRDRGPEVAWFPHPSGLCIWWNDPVNREAVGTFLRSISVQPLSDLPAARTRWMAERRRGLNP